MRTYGFLACCMNETLFKYGQFFSYLQKDRFKLGTFNGLFLRLLL